MVVDAAVDREVRAGARGRAGLGDERVTDRLHLVGTEAVEHVAQTVLVEQLSESELVAHLRQRHPLLVHGDDPVALGAVPGPHPRRRLGQLHPDWHR